MSPKLYWSLTGAIFCMIQLEINSLQKIASQQFGTAGSSTDWKWKKEYVWYASEKKLHYKT